MRRSHSNIENVLINGVWPTLDPVPFRFFDGIEIPFKAQDGYKVAVHTPDVEKALKMCHTYLGDKYISQLSGKFNLYGQPEIINGVDKGSLNWHNDLKEGANVAALMYFTGASNPDTGGHLEVRTAETKQLSAFLYPGKCDVILLNHKSTWEHKIGEFKEAGVERLTGYFDYNI
jgi:hypothetical protein